MKLLVIRHGESQADILNVHEGRADFELTELGKIQAQKMSNWVLNNFSIDKIYCSTLIRARQTAELLLKNSKANIYYEEDLMEFNNGLLAGLSWKEADSKYPIPEIEYPHTVIYGKESRIEFRARAEKIFSKIISDTKENETIVIVSHGGMIGQLYQCFLQLPFISTFSVATGDTGIHFWETKGNYRCIRFANRTSHLEINEDKKIETV